MQVVNNAYSYLKDTKYEGEIVLAEAKINLHTNDTKSALKILNAIKSDTDIFIKVCFKITLKYSVYIFMYNKYYSNINIFRLKN